MQVGFLTEAAGGEEDGRVASVPPGQAPAPATGMRHGDEKDGL